MNAIETGGDDVGSRRARAAVRASPVCAAEATFSFAGAVAAALVLRRSGSTCD